MKKNTLLGLTLISCIGVVFAVIFDDKVEETENPTDAEEEILENIIKIDSDGNLQNKNQLLQQFIVKLQKKQLNVKIEGLNKD